VPGQKFTDSNSLGRTGLIPATFGVLQPAARNRFTVAKAIGLAEWETGGRFDCRWKRGDR